MFKDSDSGFKTGNRIIKTGNGIISPTSWLPIKKTSLTTCIMHHTRIQILVLETGNRIIKTGNGIISPTS